MPVKQHEAEAPAQAPAQALSAAHIRTLVRQAARWSTAARQDESSMIAVLHANYGAGYLWSLTDLASKDAIEQAAGIDFDRFRQEIVDTQDAATTRMAGLCPAYAPPPTYLTTLGGEGGPEQEE